MYIRVHGGRIYLIIVSPDEKDRLIKLYVKDQNNVLMILTGSSLEKSRNVHESFRAANVQNFYS